MLISEKTVETNVPQFFYNDVLFVFTSKSGQKL